MFKTFGFFSSFFPSIFMLFFFLIFIIIFGLIIYSIVSGISTWNKNNHSPLLTVDATLVSKRIDVSSHTSTSADPSAHHHTHYDSSYFITFQVESGDRMEFQINGNEYGLLIEGDFGKLTFQGARYKSFQRISDRTWSNNINQ